MVGNDLLFRPAHSGGRTGPGVTPQGRTPTTDHLWPSHFPPMTLCSVDHGHSRCCSDLRFVKRALGSGGFDVCLKAGNFCCLGHVLQPKEGRQTDVWVSPLPRRKPVADSGFVCHNSGLTSNTTLKTKLDLIRTYALRVFFSDAIRAGSGDRRTLTAPVFCSLNKKESEDENWQGCSS